MLGATKRFLFTWLICSMVMFSLFYLWHGVILNDFTRIAYPDSVFLPLTAVAYLVIGLILAFALSLQDVKKLNMTKGMLTGAAVGLLIFIVVFVLGLSFNPKVELIHLLIDVCWQMLEQGVGGIVGVGIIKLMALRKQRSN